MCELLGSGMTVASPLAGNEVKLAPGPLFHVKHRRSPTPRLPTAQPPEQSSVNTSPNHPYRRTTASLGIDRRDLLEQPHTAVKTVVGLQHHAAQAVSFNQ